MTAHPAQDREAGEFASFCQAREKDILKPKSEILLLCIHKLNDLKLLKIVLHLYYRRNCQKKKRIQMYACISWTSG